MLQALTSAFVPFLFFD